MCKFVYGQLRVKHEFVRLPSRNDMVVTENNRIKILEDDMGRSILRFREAHATDTGIYKVTARNKSGQTIARCRQVSLTSTKF